MWQLTLSNVSALQIFQTLRFVAAILVSIILVKSGLDLKSVSFYEILFFLGNFVSLFWVQGMKNGLLSYFPGISKKDQKKLLFNLFALFIVLGAIASFLLFTFREEAVTYLTQYERIPYIPLACIFVLINTPTILNEFIYLLHEKSRRIIQYGVIIFSLQVMLILIGVIFFEGLRILLILMILWSIIKLIWLSLLLFNYADFKLDITLQRKFLVFSFPLVLYLLLGNAMEYIDGFIVSKYFEEEMFAIFRYGAREFPLSLILVGALVSAIIPALVTDFDANVESLKSKLSDLMKWLFPVSAILMLISPIIYPIVYSAEFELSARIFNLYLLIIITRVIVAQAFIYARHDNIILVIFALVELLVNLVLSIWWAQQIGILGIVYATIVAFTLDKIMLSCYSYFKYGIKFNQYINLRLYVGMSTLLIVAFVVSLYI